MSDYYYYEGYSGSISSDAQSQYNIASGTIMNAWQFNNGPSGVHYLKFVSNYSLYVFLCKNPSINDIEYNNTLAYFAFSNNYFEIDEPVYKTGYNAGYATAHSSGVNKIGDDYYYSCIGGPYYVFNSSYTGTYSFTLQDNLSDVTQFNTVSEMLVAVENAGIRPYQSEYPITYRLTNCTAPTAPSEAAAGDTVTVPLSFTSGYGIVNPSSDIYVTNNGVLVPSTYFDGTLTFTMPDPS